MIIYPSILPQKFGKSNYNGQFPNNTIRTNMDAGPPKVRRLFTAGVEPVSGSIFMTKAQLDFFYNWYRNALFDGSLRFGWTEPWNEDTNLTNILTNPDFSSDLTGWSENPVGDTTAAIVSGGIYGNCVQVTRDGGDYQGIDQAISLSIGNSYFMEAYVLSGTSGDESFIVNINENGVGNRHQIAGTSSSTWTHHSLDFVVVATSNQIHVYKATATAGTMLFDQVSLYDITSGISEFRFVEPPTWKYLVPDLYEVTFNLEKLP